MIFKSFLIFVSQDNRHYRLSHHWLARQCGRTFIVKLIIPNIQLSHTLVTVSQCATALPGSSDLTDTGTENYVESAHSPDGDTGHNWSGDYTD